MTTDTPAETANADGLSIRFAEPGDASLILGFIRALAEYEKLLDEVTASEAEIAATLFGPRPAAECLLVFDGEAALGFALFFHNYSTFRGAPGLYLEDLFVSPEARGRGAGKALLRELARIALERGCKRMEWAVLNWNQPAIDFYRSLGAGPMDEWTVYRLEGAALNALATPK